MNDGGPAFPAYTYDNIPEGQVVRITDYGMTLRDYFAAKVMCGLLSGDKKLVARERPGTDLDLKLCAKFAYDMADIMIAERARKP